MIPPVPGAATGLPEFGEHRVLSAVEPGRRLAYTMTTVHDGRPGFSTEGEMGSTPAREAPAPS